MGDTAWKSSWWPSRCSSEPVGLDLAAERLRCHRRAGPGSPFCPAASVRHSGTKVCRWPGAGEDGKGGHGSRSNWLAEPHEAGPEGLT